jgi:predicted small lipoprotein YifL
MKTVIRPYILVFAFALAACGGEPAAPPAADENAAAQNAAAGVETTDPAALPACPFRETRNWAGSVEGGRLLVTGNVDLQMAGFRPALTPHAGAAPGVAALDLTLVPEPQAAVTDQVRYEQARSPAYGRGEIWCGGDRIAEFDVVVVD